MSLQPLQLLVTIKWYFLASQRMRLLVDLWFLLQPLILDIILLPLNLLYPLIGRSLPRSLLCVQEHLWLPLLAAGIRRSGDWPALKKHQRLLFYLLDVARIA